MIGKVNDDFFTKSILSKTGHRNAQVVIGPAMGVDSAILKVPEGYMAVAEDPIFPSLNMTPEDFAFVTVHIGASDVAVMGIKPQFMTYSLLLPPDTPEPYIAKLISEISAEADRLGIAIVGGHTGFYGAVTVPTVGGITVWGVSDHYVSPRGAQVGDDVLITKGAGIEAAGLLGFELGKVLKGNVPGADIARAAARMREITVVKDAAVASAFKGVHAMHDATEGGVKRGVWEVAQASKKGIAIDRDALLIPQDIKNVCGFFNLSPWEIISEGTLVLTVSPTETKALRAAFAKEGIESAVIGRIVEQSAGATYTEAGVTHKLVPPQKDLFWEVFFNAGEILKEASLTPDEKLCSDLKATVDRLKKANISRLLPEIGSNIGYTVNGKTPAEVAAVPGRIFRVENETYSVRDPKMGISVYMADTLLILRRKFPEARCVMNLRSTPEILDACRKKGFRMADMPTPADYWQRGNEYDTDLEKVIAKTKELPDVITIPDRINLEKLIVVTGTSLADFERKILALNAAVAE